MKSLLIIFIKNPILGKVKTRLAKTVGDEEALRIYKQLLQHTLNTTQNLDCDKAVFYSDFIDENDSWKHFSYKQYMQHGNDLGERMKTAFSQAFDEGYKQVVIIGSDCMEISKDIITNAFLALSTYGAVIGPAYDGGYYLLGLNKMVDAVFQNKQWSSENVFSQTVADLQNSEIAYSFLLRLNDIDTAEDWDNFNALSAILHAGK